MTFILISGERIVVKTTVCNKLYDRIAADLSFTMHKKQDNLQHADRSDFFTYYEKDDKNIVLNTPSDSNSSMIETCQYLDSLAQNGVRPDIIITTIREADNISKRAYPMSRMLALLDAIGKGTKNLESHFNQNIASITSFTPTSLVHHAFVLYLEKQANGKTEYDAKMILDRYWNYKAETAKQMLDLALAHL